MHNICKLFVFLFLLSFTTNVWATDNVLANPRHVFIKMADGAKWAHEDDDAFNGGADTQINSYYIHAEGGGLNQLHITTDLDSTNGQSTTMYPATTSSSGEFWVTTTGGRGYNDSVILMVSVKGAIDNNFTLNIKSDGYVWSTTGDYLNGVHSTDVINKTLTKTDFATDSSYFGYASYVRKPGPGSETVWTLPLFNGQSDFSTTETLLFIDLKVGNIYNDNLTEKGAAKVEYSFTNMNTSASFNVYGWCHDSNQGQGINWTQRTDGTGNSGYTVVYTP